VVNHREFEVLRIDTTQIVVEVVGGVDTAADGTVEEEFSLHLVSTSDMVVLRSIVLGVVHGGAAVETIVTLSGRRPGAVSAEINVLAHAVDKVVSSVLLARRVRNTVLKGIFVNLGRVATVAGATSLAVNDDLSVEANGSVTLQTEVDVESVSESRGGTLSPA